MLEKPAISDEELAVCLQKAYSVRVSSLQFLPLGADPGTAVYRVVTEAHMELFIKMRRSPFDEITVIIPHLLHEQGVTCVIAPIPSISGSLWVQLGSFHLMVYPFVQGSSGFEKPLSKDHWAAFGTALKRLHTAPLPAHVLARVQPETYSAEWRERVKAYQVSAALETYSDPIASEFADFLTTKQGAITALIDHADRLAVDVQQRELPAILCHADIHVGNILVSETGSLFIVDWDTLVIAPKERDLMFVGGGLGGGTYSPEAERAYFYQGYGAVEIDPAAIAYYRCERIVQDVAVYCQQILSTTGDSADRLEGMKQLKRQFEPVQVVEIALQSARELNR